MRFTGRSGGVVTLLALLVGCASGGSSSIQPPVDSSITTPEDGRAIDGPIGIEPVAVYGHGRAVAAHADASGALAVVTTTGIHRSESDGAEIRTVHLFDPASQPERAAFSADGSEVAVLVGESRTVVAYATGDGALTRSWTAPDGATVRDLWFEPTAGQLVLTTSAGPVVVDAGATDAAAAAVAPPTGRLGVMPDGTIVGAVLDSADLVRVRAGTAELHPVDLDEGERVEDVRVAPDGATIGVTVPSSADEFEQVHRVLLLDDSLDVVGSVATGLRLDPRTWTVANDRLIVAHETELTAWTADGTELGRAETTGIVADVYPAGDEVVIIGRDGAIARWDGESAPVELAAGSVTGTFGAVAPDLVTTVDLFGRIDVRRLADGAPLRSEDAFAVGGLTALALSSDGSSLAVGSTAGNVMVLDPDLDPTRALAAAPYGVHVDAVAFDPGSGGLVTGLAERLGSEAFDDTVIAWSDDDTERFRALGDAEATPGCAFFNAELQFDPSGALIVAATHDFGVAVIDAATGEVIDDLPGSATIVDLAFTADGSKLVVIHDDGVVDVWDAAERSLLASYRPAQPGVAALATIPGTDQMVVADLTGALSILDVLSGETLRVLDGATVRSRALAVSPDGTLLAAPGADGTIGLWSIASGAQVGVASGHTGGVTALTFAANATSLYSASDDGTVRSWAVAGG